jgi:hypothetical protein
MRRPIFLLIIALALTSFIYLWNPIGFQDLFSDEGCIYQNIHAYIGGLRSPADRDLL